MATDVLRLELLDRALDEALVLRALEAWTDTYAWITRKEKVRGSMSGFGGPTFDTVLAQAGITWDSDRFLYQAYEREVRRRAQEALGLTTYDRAS